MLRGEPVGDGRGRVARAVVDDDDLERPGDRRQALERLAHERLEVRLLVVGREEVREPVDRLAAGAAARDARASPRRGRRARGTGPRGDQTPALEAGRVGRVGTADQLDSASRVCPCRLPIG